MWPLKETWDTIIVRKNNRKDVKAFRRCLLLFQTNRLSGSGISLYETIVILRTLLHIFHSHGKVSLRTLPVRNTPLLGWSRPQLLGSDTSLSSHGIQVSRELHLTPIPRCHVVPVLGRWGSSLGDSLKDFLRTMLQFKSPHISLISSQVL